MADRRKLTEDEVREALAGVPECTYEDGKLHLGLEFLSFVEAFGLM